MRIGGELSGTPPWSAVRPPRPGRAARLACAPHRARAHSLRHVAAMRVLHERLDGQIAAGRGAYAQIDPDTAMYAHSWDAALRAAGAVLDATDAVMAGQPLAEVEV